MRLLFLSADPGVPVLGHKGASVHLRELCAAFAQAGVEVHIASPRIAPEGDALRAPAALHQIAPVLAKEHSPRTLDDAVKEQERAVTALCRMAGIDAVYERFSLFTTAGVCAAAELGLPHVLEVNAPLREEAARFRTLPHPGPAESFESRVMARTDRVLAVSRPLAETLARSGVARQKIEIVPNGVAVERFREPRRDPERFVVGFSGSLKPWHGIDALVDAVVRVPEAHLEVAGHGPQEHLLDRVPSERLTRLGTLTHDESIARMAGWNVGVAPYAPLDGFWFSPLKVLEYMAASVCPVATELGDTAALLGHGSRGVLVRPGDAGALARALAALAREPERAWTLGERAKRWVAANRSWSANAQTALEALAAAQTKKAA